MTEQQQNNQEEVKATVEAPTLEAWDTLTEDQQKTLKEALLKSKYGIGGEHFSTFPTLLDNKVNEWVEETYKVSKLPRRVSEATFKKWEANGTLEILPLHKDNKTHYLLVLLPKKNLKMDVWELDKEDVKPYLKYTTNNKLGELTFTAKHFHILNGYTNKNKAFNQAKALVKLLELGKPFQELEAEKELKTNQLELNINDKGQWELIEIGKNSMTPTGKTFNGLEEYYGRKQHQKVPFNYIEHIG